MSQLPTSKDEKYFGSDDAAGIDVKLPKTFFDGKIGISCVLC